MSNSPGRLAVLLVAALGLAACASPQGAASEARQQAEQGGPKRIVASVQADVHTLYNKLNPRSARPGIMELEEMVNAGLTNSDPQSVRQPQLAQAVPTLENGLWKLFPDGRMETTWTIRSDAGWHDGSPYTTADLLFTLAVARDPELPEFGGEIFRLIGSADAVDTRTIVVRWTQPRVDADGLFSRSAALPLPKHVLEGVYQEDKASFRDLPYWTSSFVGTGPYKVAEFERGSHMVLQAHDRYVLGRPQIDEIEVRFIPDSNTIVANVLAGVVEVTIGRGLSLDQGLQVRERWHDGKVETPLSNWMGIHPQLFTPAPPAVGNVAFRRALLHAIDRQTMADTLLFGMGQVAHVWLDPNEAEYWDIADRVPRYEYDPRRSEQLVTELGYSKRGDGFFYDAAGQRLAVEIRTTGDNDIHIKMIHPVADYWQRAGVATEAVVIPVQRQTDLEYRATFPGFEMLKGPAGTGGMAAAHSSRTPLPENNFRVTGNYSRHMNPEYDALYDRYTKTIPLAERKQLVEQAMRYFAEQQVKMGMFYDVGVAMIGNRLRNVSATRMAWNSHEWQVR